MARRVLDPLAKELDAIKRLLVLQLLTSGVQAKDVAHALGVDKSVVSRLVPARRVGKKTAR
jgi:predicted transcriptional regulator